MPADLLTAGLTVFATIFLFEIVDRTNFGVIGLATKHDHLVVWMGAAVAFVVSTAIAVALGFIAVDLLSTYLADIKVLGGLILIAFGVRGLLKGEEKQAEEAEARVEHVLSPSKVWLTAFTLILFLEMGDNTQILTIILVADVGVWWVVFIGACLALFCVSGLGAHGGKFLKGRISPDRLDVVLSLILIVVGSATILLALDPHLLPTWL